MEPSSYQALRRDVHKAVLEHFVRNDEKDKRFLPLGDAQNILYKARLRDFFDCLLEEATSATLLSAVPEDVKIERVDSRQLYNLIALILFSACNVQAACSLVTVLILSDEKRWLELNTARNTGKGQHVGLNTENSLGSLPLTREDCDVIFPPDHSHALVTIDQILSNQSSFCPIVLFANEEQKILATENRRFPYIEERAIGEGSFGEVFM